MPLVTCKPTALLFGLFCLLSVICPGTAADVDLTKLPPSATRPVDFLKDIQPILEQNCLRCHGAQRAEADLRWDLKESALKGSDHGPVIAMAVTDS